MPSCRWLFVHKKCNLASLFSLASPSLIEGGILWLGCKLIQWMVALFVWSSFLFYWCTQTIPILYEWLSNCKISLWQFDRLGYTNAKCGNSIGWATKLIIIIVKSANICIHCIYRKIFWPAYAQLGMLGAIFTMVPVVALTAIVTEQTKCHTCYCCYVIHVIQSQDPEIITVNPNRQNIFYMFNMTIHWWWQNQSAASSVHSKTTSYGREDAPYSDLLQFTYL